MLLPSLLALLWPLVRADYACVCTHHVSTRIFPRPSTHAEPSGIMYKNDCKPEATVAPSTTFLAIQHYHQVGFVVNDADTFRHTCPGVIDKDDLVVPTSPAPTRCNKFALFSDIAKGMNVGLHAAITCADGVSYDADAIVTTFCGALPPNVWLKGRKVIDHCPNIPQYSPVATFDNAAQYLQSAGILLGCETDAFYIATQNCTSNVDIHRVAMASYPPASDYYVVEW